MRDTSRKSAASSRLSRSCEPAGASGGRAAAPAAGAAVTTCEYHVGATAIICGTIPESEDGSSASSASSTGRYASEPASRSEQRPRAITGAG